MYYFYILLLTVFSTACIAGSGKSLPLESIQLPPNFHIMVFADKIDNARSLTRDERGRVFVGSQTTGNIYALEDIDKDGKADKRWRIASDLYMPNGVAWHKNDLYIAENSRLLRVKNVSQALHKEVGMMGGSIRYHIPNTEEIEILYDRLPNKRHHGWRYIGFSPQGQLFISLGVPCNVCRTRDPVGTISYFDSSFQLLTPFAKGVRNSVGFTWHPQHHTLWFTDNGRDMLGDDIPSDELNHAPKSGLHFGFPYCHEGTVPDPNYGRQKNCKKFTAPAHKLGAHVASLGLRFYTGSQFPKAYQHKLFIAEHGSWNRTEPTGYRIVALTLNKQQQVIKEEIFATGWLDNGQVWGRPVDLLVMPDGALLVSDDYAGVIYRIFYKK